MCHSRKQISVRKTVTAWPSMHLRDVKEKDAQQTCHQALQLYHSFHHWRKLYVPQIIFSPLYSDMFG